MAKIIGVLNNKGGLGKSSICHLFAITSGNEPLNKKVLVIDASSNKCLSYLNVYKPQNYYTIVQDSLENVPSILTAEAENFNLIIIDFSNDSDDQGFKTAALCCEMFIIPTGTGIMDQIATKSTLGLVNEIAKLRKAAGFNTEIKILPSNVINQEEVDDLLAELDKQKIDHFEYALLKDQELAYKIEQNEPIMDYVTEGIDWTPGQSIFHNVFIEFHKQTENA